MPALTTSSSAIARTWTRHALPTASRASVAALPTQQRRSVTEVSTGSSFDSPFKGIGSSEKTTSIPSFAKYKSSAGEERNKVFQYFMAGTFGAVTALGAKATVQGT